MILCGHWERLCERRFGPPAFVGCICGLGRSRTQFAL
jgi:hypothetical protein